MEMEKEMKVFSEMYGFMENLYNEGITDYDELCEKGFEKWDKNDPELKDLIYDATATLLDEINFEKLGNS